MTDAESLLLLLGALYVFECLAWVPGNATVVFTHWGRRWRWAGTEQLWGNPRGAVLLLNLLPGWGTALLCGGEAPTLAPTEPDIRQRLAHYRQATRWLRPLCWALLVHLFGGGGYLVWVTEADWAVVIYLGIALPLVLASVTLFARAHRRLYPQARGERWLRIGVLLVCPPATVRAVDNLALGLFAGAEPLALIRAVCPPAQYQDYARRLFHDQQRLAEHPELAQPPWTDEPSVQTYCPRCHALYQTSGGHCRDCPQVPLQRLPDQADKKPRHNGCQISS